MYDLKNSILDIANDNFKYLMSLENVNGVGLGYKHINKVNTFEPCIHVLVQKKVNQKYLFKNNIIPKNYMGIKTDVIDNGGIFKFQNSTDVFNKKIRPIEAGYSVSATSLKTLDIDIGTIGCIVKKFNYGKMRYYILSNNHVLASLNKVALGTPVIQPAFNDDAILSPFKYKVGILSEFIPMKKQILPFWPVNYMDCAIAEIINNSLISNKIANLGVLKGIAKPTLGLNVKKVGMVTGITEGEINTMGLTTTIYEGEKSYLFKNQVFADIKSGVGDSGAIVINNNNEAIGLHFAGTETKSIFTDISSVLKKLKVELFF